MKGDFLDFTKEHILSEDECELVSYYRFLDTKEKQLLLQTGYHLSENKVDNKAN